MNVCVYQAVSLREESNVDMFIKSIVIGGSTEDLQHMKEKKDIMNVIDRLEIFSLDEVSIDYLMKSLIKMPSINW